MGKVVLFNGTNGGPESNRYLRSMGGREPGHGRSTGSRAVDVRTALIVHFRDEGTILIATEAASEGVNLQFCSLVINYDLPWIRRESSNALDAATVTARSMMLW